MENLVKQTSEPLGWKKSLLWMTLAVACFHAAYTSLKFPAAGLLIFGYALGLVKLCEQSSVRRAFYIGLVTGYLCYAPQAFFLAKIFYVAAPLLWLVLAFWVGLFTALSCAAMRRWGRARAMWLIPILWTGIEYFRSELYPLKFSWLNVGYLAQEGFSSQFLGLYGMYGVGLIVFGVGVALNRWRELNRWPKVFGFVSVILLVAHFQFFLNRFPVLSSWLSGGYESKIVGIQLEFPSPTILPKILTQALTKNANAQIFVLSEYTLNDKPGGVPDALKDWCREHGKFLIVGGKEFVTNDIYYNTAFVVGTNGEVVFKQVKSVPIQFFRDGLPAPKQEVWNSPWGKIGICVCYDLSYTRVTDRLVEQGAQLIICPTMDVEGWGRHQHELHSRVAPVRAAEYGVPIFRLASSGISQAVTGGGNVVAQAPLLGNGEILSAQLRLPRHGSLPLDRWLAPLCTVMTGMILAWLLFVAGKEKCAAKKNSAAP
jgi:apolipoprotein N-acyltransferase